MNGFGTNPRAVSQIVELGRRAGAGGGRAPTCARARSAATSRSRRSGGDGAGAARATPLISLTVTGAHRNNTAAAANALAAIVVEQTTAPYVGVEDRDVPDDARQRQRCRSTSVNKRLSVIQRAESAAKNLDPLQQLVIVSQEDNAETRLGNLIAQQETLQQQLAFAKEVESAKVVEPARS